MKKIIFSVIAATVALSPLSFQVANANFDAEPSYKNLTETTSFYRVTRGFVSPLYELDNNFDTSIEFAKGRFLTYMDYIFVNDVFVKEIHFTSNDSAMYQRVLLMENGQIRQQYDFSKYPNGVIPVNFDTQSIDTIKLQFNGAEGTNHTLTEFEVVGNVRDGSPINTGASGAEFITPTIISELLPEEEPGSGTGSGDGEAPAPEEPVTEEDEGSTPGEGTGEPVAPEEPVVDEDNGDSEGTPGESTPLDPPVVVEDDGTSGSGEGTGTPIEEGTDENEDNVGDGEFIDNGEEEATPTSPEDGDVIIPEVPTIPGDGDTVVPPTTPEDGDGEVITPETPEVDDEEQPVTDPIDEEAPVVVIPPIVDEPTISICKAHPLTPSVFKNKHVYDAYSVNAASLKLMSHNHYDESFLLNKLSKSAIVMNGETMNISQFISVLKLSKFTHVKAVGYDKVDCNSSAKGDLDKLSNDKKDEKASSAKINDKKSNKKASSNSKGKK